MLGRAVRWVGAQFAFLLVFGVLAGATIYLLLKPDQWRRGIDVIGCSMLLAGVLRAAVPTKRVGVLVIRGRVVDTVAFLILGAVILAAEVRLHSG